MSVLFRVHSRIICGKWVPFYRIKECTILDVRVKYSCRIIYSYSIPDDTILSSATKDPNFVLVKKTKHCSQNTNNKH